MLSSKFEFEINQISSLIIRTITKRVLDEKAPLYIENGELVSKSSYYSNAYSKEPITIINRIKSSVRLLLIMLSNPLVNHQFTRLEKDLLISATIMHDLCMKGILPDPTPAQIFEHPLLINYLAPDNLNQVELDYFLAISSLIATHHGIWNASDKSSVVLPEVTNTSQFYLHLCDYLASKTVVWVDTSDDPSVTRNFSLY